MSVHDSLAGVDQGGPTNQSRWHDRCHTYLDFFLAQCYFAYDIYARCFVWLWVLQVLGLEDFLVFLAVEGGRQ